MFQILVVRAGSEAVLHLFWQRMQLAIKRVDVDALPAIRVTHRGKQRMSYTDAFGSVASG
jgi:hypothetical protein